MKKNLNGIATIYLNDKKYFFTIYGVKYQRKRLNK